MQIDISQDERFQSLIGFGANIAFIEGELNDHPQKEEIYDVMFADSGVDAMRLRNVFVDPEADLADTTELMNEASERLGRRPVLVLSSSSPPASLKVNSSALCAGNWDTCTLVRDAEGAFDYAGFAQYWHESLGAYLDAGIEPDFVSIQNDANWVPPQGASLETCRFLPEEGSTNVTIDGADVEVEYPGYADALRAVQASIEDLSWTPSFIGPETTSVQATIDFMNAMSDVDLAGIAHHLYATDAVAPDQEAAQALADLGRELSVPILQTEMTIEGMETALLMQHALVDIGASMYLQTDFVSSAGRTEPDKNALISLSDTAFTVNDPYYVFQHFSHDTQPGFTRIGAHSTQGDVRVSAWMAPDESSVTLVLVNPQTTSQTASLDFGDFAPATITVRRTVFPGSERYVDLGNLEPDQGLEIPAESIITLVAEQ